MPRWHVRSFFARAAPLQLLEKAGSCTILVIGTQSHRYLLGCSYDSLYWRVEPIDSGEPTVVVSFDHESPPRLRTRSWHDIC